MNKKVSGIINIRYGNIFPLRGVIFGYLILIGSMVIFMSTAWSGVVMFIIGLGIVTASEGTDIDHNQKKYREYNKLYWMKMGEWNAYDHIEKIFINSVLLSSGSRLIFWDFYTGPSTQQFGQVSGGTHYKAFIKMSNGKKIAIKCEADKERLMKELAGISRKLNTILIDQTIRN